MDTYTSIYTYAYNFQIGEFFEKWICICISLFSQTNKDIPETE